MLYQRCVFTGLIITSAICSPAISQEQNTPDGNIETVTVYAQKRAQDIAEVAIPITVVSGDTIKELQLKDTTQISSLVPNFKITNNAGEGTPPSFNIRGIGMIDYNTSSVSPISVYSDSVVSGSANNLSSNLFDVEHLEVLRGPQGTLFGRNTTGGAVLIHSRMPESEFGGYISVGAAEHNTTNAEGAVNIPTNAEINSRLSFNYDNYDFSTNNLFPGAPDGGLRQLNLRWITTADFDDLRITAKLHKDDWSGSPKPIQSLGVNHATEDRLCTVAELGSRECLNNYGHSVQSEDFWDTSADTADREHDSDTFGASLKLEWDVNDKVMLTSITAHRDLERFHSWDSDGPGNFTEGTMDTDNQLFSQELTLSYQGERSYWIGGLFYLNEEIIQENSIDLARDLRAVPIPEVAANALEVFYHNDLENESVALFGQVDYQLADDFTLTAGLRYTDESTEWSSAADFDVVGAFIPNVWDLSGEVEDDEVSAKLALVQKAGDNTSIYYSYARGYKSGGYNGAYVLTPNVAANSEYSPEIMDAYEIGSRWLSSDKMARVNLSAFYYDYQDMQIFVLLGDGSPFGILDNADSTIYGLEGEFSLATNKGWQFDLNIGYIPEAEIDEAVVRITSIPASRLPFTSEWNIGGRAQWEGDIEGGVIRAELGFDYQSDFYFDQNENPYTEQQGYALWNGRLSYELNSGVTFGIWAKNLFNKEYAELRFDSVAGLSAITELKGEQRQFGFDVTYNF